MEEALIRGIYFILDPWWGSYNVTGRAAELLEG